MAGVQNNIKPYKICVLCFACICFQNFACYITPRSGLGCICACSDILMKLVVGLFFFSLLFNPPTPPLPPIHCCTICWGVAIWPNLPKPHQNFESVEHGSGTSERHPSWGGKSAERSERDAAQSHFGIPAHSHEYSLRVM